MEKHAFGFASVHRSRASKLGLNHVLCWTTSWSMLRVASGLSDFHRCLRKPQRSAGSWQINTTGNEEGNVCLTLQEQKMCRSLAAEETSRTSWLSSVARFVFKTTKRNKRKHSRQEMVWENVVKPKSRRDDFWAAHELQPNLILDQNRWLFGGNKMFWHEFREELRRCFFF